MQLSACHKVNWRYFGFSNKSIQKKSVLSRQQDLILQRASQNRIVLLCTASPTSLKIERLPTKNTKIQKSQGFRFQYRINHIGMEFAQRKLRDKFMRKNDCRTLKSSLLCITKREDSSLESSIAQHSSSNVPHRFSFRSSLTAKEQSKTS